MATTLSSRDMEILLGAMQSTKTEFAVDYEKLAKCIGLKNANVARVSWAGVKKKLDAMKKEGGAAAETPKSTPKSTKGSKRKAIDELSADDDEILAPSTSKKGKRTRKSETPAKEEIEAIIGTEDGADGVKPEPED